MTERPLTERQKRFAEAWVRLGNATAAAREAGYKGSDNALGVQGHDNLKKPKLVEYIRQLGEATRSAKVASRQEREEFLTAVMRGEIADHVIRRQDGVEVVEEAAPVIRDRTKAAELLAKMHGDLIEKREHSGPKGAPIKSETTVKVDLATAVRIARGAKEGGE